MKMVHKKFLKINGKTYGPYFYESYRENGRVKKRYVKNPSEKEQKSSDSFFSRLFAGSRVKPVLFVGAVLLIGILGFFLFNHFGLTGNVSLDIRDSYVAGENLSGIMNLVLSQGELIPANAKLVVSQNGETREFFLSELVNANDSGSFYVSGQNISGSGEGIGFAGEKIAYPDVYFTLLLSENSQENQTSINESAGGGSSEDVNNTENNQPANETLVENQTQETTNQNQTEIIPPIENQNQTSSEGPSLPNNLELPPDNLVIPEVPAVEPSPAPVETPAPVEQVSEQSSSDSESSSSESVSESTPSSDSLITGNVILDSGDEEVEGVVSANTSFEYNTNKFASVKNVYSDYETLSASDLNLIQENGKVVVTTGYAYSERGFGLDFVGSDKKEVAINLSRLNISARQGTLTVTLEYENLTLAEASQEISVLNESLVNQTVVNQTIKNITNDNFTLKQYKAVINKPVKWVKIAENTESIEIPKEAENISIKTGEEVQQAVSDAESSVSKVDETPRSEILTGNVISFNSESGGGFFTKLFSFFGLTGNAISDTPDVTETLDSKIVDVSNLGNTSESVAVVYETPAPTSEEIDLTNGKRIIVSSDGEFNYTDILAYTTIPNLIKIENNNSIKVYHYVWVSEENISVIPEVVENISLVNNSIAEINDTVEITNQSDVAVINNDSVVIVVENISAPVVESVAENVTSTSVAVPAVETQTITPAENLTKQEVKAEEKANKSAEQVVKKETKKDKKGSLSITGNAILDASESVSSNLSEIVEENILGHWVKEEVPFNAYDLDGDGKVDYIEWNIEHLSNQTYEIIYITKAEHLDENLSFVEDVYSSVKDLDGNYTTIPDSHTLRVTFEQNLTNQKDITIYARTGCNGSIMINNVEVPCSIYEEKMRIDEIRRMLGE